jgi:hypothetical protein
MFRDIDINSARIVAQPYGNPERRCGGGGSVEQDEI